MNPEELDRLAGLHLVEELTDEEARALALEAKEGQDTFNTLGVNEEMRAGLPHPEAWPKEVLAELGGRLAPAEAERAAAFRAASRSAGLRRIGLAAAAVLVAGFVAWNRKLFEGKPPTPTPSAAPVPKASPPAVIPRQEPPTGVLPGPPPAAASVPRGMPPAGPPRLAPTVDVLPGPPSVVEPMPTSEIPRDDNRVLPAPTAVPPQAPESFPEPQVAEPSPILEDVLFSPGGAELSPDQNSGLDRTANLLVSNPHWAVDIEAYDDAPRATDVPPLWKQRANAVRVALASRGVNPKQFEKISQGTCPEKDAECRGRNHRVRLVPYQLK